MVGTTEIIYPKSPQFQKVSSPFGLWSALPNADRFSTRTSLSDPLEGSQPAPGDNCRVTRTVGSMCSGVRYATAIISNPQMNHLNFSRARLAQPSATILAHLGLTKSFTLKSKLQRRSYGRAIAATSQAFRISGSQSFVADRAMNCSWPCVGLGFISLSVGLTENATIRGPSPGSW